mmetsp:Transcript_25940/g.52034  ORF Transcript_25940/g.52034 Transcript_25940/m.52034 type:complete len:533 (-) Transcript_25940:67-1665(-)|eukprot:CAMPEP_0113377506 /NCGR_PEP_ID=MMETSP0013_2-20120614/3201_1 /TAXON_ID=2843 ORGANISM="Skeletonema costatum, Strain 1716" /NCGR_SAMPLE_ID=MMETSP0013_2 /ASSEMBLY_ACC=CAM_ASM_000158 /LENGTH=532 /DNA_ID=CAMNT_0000259663 /DNA_START=33 /DNA_END=1631 /DNA_ORIENTATION=+ /assembly_acc=CAM_ASM_000158
MSNLAAYCPPVNSGAQPPSTSTTANKRPPPSSSFSANNFNDDNPEDDQEQQTELKRRCIDYHTPAVLDLTSRLYRKSNRRSHALPGGAGLAYPYLQCHTNYIKWMGLPLGEVGSSRGGDPIPSTAFLTHLAHVTRAKNSSPVMCLSWTPGGRRLLTGNQEGEFTLWDGINFSFELIMSAHDSSFRCMAWSHNQNYLLTSDGGGNIKYWSPSIAPVQSIDSHDGQAIHALSFSPADTKFVSCGDDATVRIWDWAGRREERVLEGHGWDVKCVQWHPRSSVICSGSKDNLVKLWDPRQGGCLSTLYGHKNTVTKVAWNDNGNWLLTASRDQLIKLYDIRAMKELCSLKGHHKEVTSIAWHPIYETVFASGGMDGTLIYWNVGPKGSEEPAVKIPFAHDMAIWDMKWHPAGHLLATGSNDRQTKFFARNRPGMKQGLDDDGLEVADGGAYDNEIIQAEMELGNHVGIVIGRRGATIIAMQRQTKTKMHVDQIRRVLQIEGTARQIETVKKRVGALLDRVSSDNEDRGQGGGFGGF